MLFARWNIGLPSVSIEEAMFGGRYYNVQRDRERIYRQQIEILGGRVPLSSRLYPRATRWAQSNTGRSNEMRIFVSQTARGPPILIRSRSGWTFGSKVVASGAGLILLIGAVLTLMTVNSKMDMETYRPFIFTVFGLLFIIIGPIIACRMVLNAYDRRLLREQRQFENLARRMRRQAQPGSEGGGVSLLGSRARSAVEYILGTGRRTAPIQLPAHRDASDWFPDTLPSYDSALDLENNEHWSKKFFNDAPPPYRDVVDGATIARSRSLTDVCITSLVSDTILVPDDHVDNTISDDQQAIATVTPQQADDDTANDSQVASYSGNGVVLINQLAKREEQ